MRPMLATVADRVPSGDAWVHEVKWDGMRVLVDVRDGVVTVWSRNERDVTASYPELDGIGEDYADMLLDGEVVALDEVVPASTRSPSGCTSPTGAGRSGWPPPDP